jgi:hypothetical protein
MIAIVFGYGVSLYQSVEYQKWKFDFSGQMTALNSNGADEGCFWEAPRCGAGFIRAPFQETGLGKAH